MNSKESVVQTTIIIKFFMTNSKIFINWDSTYIARFVCISLPQLFVLLGLAGWHKTCMGLDPWIQCQQILKKRKFKRQKQLAQDIIFQYQEYFK